MTERPMLGVRVPPEWKADLETIAARKGQTVSQALYDAIAQYLDREAVNSVNRFMEPSSQQTAEVLSGQVLAVLTDLRQQVQALAGMETRMAETIAAQLQTALTGFPRQAESVNTEELAENLATKLQTALTGFTSQAETVDAETATEPLQTALTAPVKPSSPRKLSKPVKPKTKKKVSLYNQQKALDAQQRIKDTVAALKNTNNFPSGITARANAIVPLAQCSKQTLNKHRQLWDPRYHDMGVL